MSCFVYTFCHRFVLLPSILLPGPIAYSKRTVPASFKQTVKAWTWSSLVDLESNLGLIFKFVAKRVFDSLIHSHVVYFDRIYKERKNI